MFLGMKIFERIPELDQKMIKQYIECYGAAEASELTLKAPLDHILRFWDTNKVDLFNLFGGELILTKNMTFNKPQEDIEEEICNMMCHDGNDFQREFNKWVRTTYMDVNNNTMWNLYELIYTRVLATNTWDGGEFSIITPDDHKITVAPGCKVSKVLGKIARAFNIEGYEKFRIAHSMCLNQKKLTGELCISIHPLDYMTMSDNECDWSSCMSWQEYGDYRQGTVEMMNSPCVVVAYLKSANNMRMPYGYEWNSKKWRQLFIVTPHLITGIREYPYQCPELNCAVLNWLRQLAERNMTWGPFSETMSKVKNHHDNVFADLGCHSHFDFHCNMMYNDFYAEHNSYVAATIPEHYALCFSGESECMQCGEDITNYGYDERCTCFLTCNSCEHICYCAECGERINYDDAVSIDGYYYCEYCAENHFIECTFCEETHHESNVRQVYLCVNDNRTTYHINVCDNCINSNEFINQFGMTFSCSH